MFERYELFSRGDLSSIVLNKLTACPHPILIRKRMSPNRDQRLRLDGRQG